jgi:hypothetical protein
MGLASGREVFVVVLTRCSTRTRREVDQRGPLEIDAVDGEHSGKKTGHCRYFRRMFEAIDRLGL